MISLSLTIWVCRWLLRRKWSFWWPLPSPHDRSWSCWWSTCRRTSPLWSEQKRQEELKPDLFIYIFIYSIWVSSVWSAWTSKPHIKTAFHHNKHWQQTKGKKKGYWKSSSRKKKKQFCKDRKMKKQTSSMTYFIYLGSKQECDIWTRKAYTAMTETNTISQYR